jgi:prepilin-type N-terminal cleavage/methylation domain-containing protein
VRTKSRIENPKSRTRRGTSLIELLVAAFIVAIAAGWAVATWSISSRAPATKRVTEMGTFIAVQEIERFKSQRFGALTNGAQTARYFDKFGASLGTGVAPPNGSLYRAVATVTTVVNRDVIGNTEDLIEIQVVVTNPDGTVTFETARTLLTFGGR